jgi:hypothetical protein
LVLLAPTRSFGRIRSLLRATASRAGEDDSRGEDDKPYGLGQTVVVAKAVGQKIQFELKQNN